MGDLFFVQFKTYVVLGPPASAAFHQGALYVAVPTQVGAQEGVPLI